MLDNFPEDMNITTRFLGNLSLASEEGNIYLNTNDVKRFKVDASGNVYSYGNRNYLGITY